MSVDFESISENAVYSHQYQITETVYNSFLQAFQDFSPVHVDEQYALNKGFKSRVMHGNILNGFISHFIGMVCPGENAFLHSINIQYKNPSYLNDEIMINAAVSQKVDSVRVVIFNMDLLNITQNLPAATARVQAGVR